MTLQIFGYAGCTTVKKARDWAEENNLDPHYAHFNKLDDLGSRLDTWIETAGIDQVFNDKAQTLRKMDEAERATIMKSEATKREAMIADPRLIKRPVGTDGKTVLAGFDRAAWERAFLS